MNDITERTPPTSFSPRLWETPQSPSSPDSENNKSAFLAAYGLELDEEEEDEEEEDDEQGQYPGGQRNPHTTPKRGKKKSTRGGILKRTFSPPRRDAPSSPSLVDNSKRASSIVGLVRSRSPSTNNEGNLSPTAILSGGNRQSNYNSNKQGLVSSPVLKDYSIRARSQAPISLEPSESRRGFVAGEDDDDDASSASHYPSSAADLHLPLGEDHESAMNSLEFSPVASSNTHVTSDVDNTSKLDDASSSVYDGDSWESGSGKASGDPLTPPSLPKRPLEAQIKAQPDRIIVDQISIATPPPTLPPRRSVTLESNQSTLSTKEQAKQLAAQKKAVLAEEKEKKVKEESKKKREERERKILLKSYEELEVERFLTDFGKHVHQVRSTGFVDPDHGTHSWPQREDWRHNETQQLNVAGFTFAYVLSFLSYLSPSRFMDLQSGHTTEDLQEAMHEDQFRLAALRANAERLYMTALPIYEGLFGKMRQVWRWDSKIKTFFWCGIYFTFWFRGMLLPAMFALMIINVLRIGSYPPKPEVLRNMLLQQQRRTMELQQAKEAKGEDVIRQAQEDPTSPIEKEGSSSTSTAASKKKNKTKYGLAADATRRYGKAATMLTSALADVHERIKNFVMWRSVPATWRALVLLSLAMMVTFLSTPWMMARLPGLALGICFFFVAPIMEHRPEWMGVEWSNPFDFLLAGVPNDAQYAMIVLRKRAAMGEALTGDKDVAHWMNDEYEGAEDEEKEENDGTVEIGNSLIPTMGGLEESNGAVAMSTAVDKAATNGSASVDWKKWKSRMAKGREMAVAGSEMLSGTRPVQLPRLNGGQPLSSTTGVDGGEATMGVKMMAGMAKGINWGLDSIQETSNRKLIQRRLEPDEVTSASDGVYWAVHLGSCGHVVVTPERIRFRSMFARKMDAAASAATDSKEAKEEEKDHQINVLDPTTGQCQVTESQLQTAKVRTLVDLRLESILQLKKTKSVNVGVWGIDGLEVRSRGGKVYQFSSLVKRDEAFNRILALAPQNWSKT